MTGTVPPALRDRTTLDNHLLVQYAVFREVESGRRYSNGDPLQLGPADILAYCNLYAVPRSEISLIADAVQLFDHVWMDLKIAERNAKKTNLSAPSA